MSKSFSVDTLISKSCEAVAGRTFNLLTPRLGIPAAEELYHHGHHSLVQSMGPINPVNFSPALADTFGFYSQRGAAFSLVKNGTGGGQVDEPGPEGGLVGPHHLFLANNHHWFPATAISAMAQVSNPYYAATSSPHEPYPLLSAHIQASRVTTPQSVGSKIPDQMVAFRDTDSKVGSSKRVRTAFTSTQLLQLEREFTTNMYLSRIRRIEIARYLSLSEKQVKIWFQNRRVRFKKEENRRGGGLSSGKCRCLPGWKVVPSPTEDEYPGHVATPGHDPCSEAEEEMLVVVEKTRPTLSNADAQASFDRDAAMFKDEEKSSAPVDLSLQSPSQHSSSSEI